MEQEAAEDYAHHGLYHACIGEVIHKRYHVIRKVGWGNFSTVWLTWDSRRKRFAALKIAKSQKDYTQTALDEAKMLKLIAKRAAEFEKDPPTNWDVFLGKNHVVKYFDNFRIKGAPDPTTGKRLVHYCIVTEILGESMLTLLHHTKYQGLHGDVLYRFCKESLRGLAFLHHIGVIHTDIKPENILVVKDDKEICDDALDILDMIKHGELLPAEAICSVGIPDNVQAWHKTRSYGKRQNYDLTVFQGTVSPTIDVDKLEIAITTYRDSIGELENGPEYKIADLGNACYNWQHFTENIQTLQYQSPETLFGSGYDSTADIFSLGCTIYELAVGEFLFEPRHCEDDRLTKEQSHLLLMQEVLGPIPFHVFAHGSLFKKTLEDGNLLGAIISRPSNSLELQEILHSQYLWDIRSAFKLTAFLLPMLRWDRENRASALECLRHEWMRR